uniref:Uncharacterized protein n=1 Tax=Ixodes ricinus TaxID=34613 RepID=A0A6B0UW09_IXORI
MPTTVPLRRGLAHFLWGVVCRGFPLLELAEISIGAGVVALLVPVPLEETEEDEAKDDADGQQNAQRDAHNLPRIARVADASDVDTPGPESVLLALADLVPHQAVAVVAREANGAPHKVPDFALAPVGRFVQRGAANHFFADLLAC